MFSLIATTNDCYFNQFHRQQVKHLSLKHKQHHLRALQLVTFWGRRRRRRRLCSGQRRGAFGIGSRRRGERGRDWRDKQTKNNRRPMWKCLPQKLHWQRRRLLSLQKQEFWALYLLQKALRYDLQVSVHASWAHGSWTKACFRWAANHWCSSPTCTHQDCW